MMRTTLVAAAVLATALARRGFAGKHHYGYEATSTAGAAGTATHHHKPAHHVEKHHREAPKQKHSTTEDFEDVPTYTDTTGDEFDTLDYHHVAHHPNHEHDDHIEEYKYEDDPCMWDEPPAECWDDGTWETTTEDPMTTNAAMTTQQVEDHAAVEAAMASAGGYHGNHGFAASHDKKGFATGNSFVHNGLSRAHFKSEMEAFEAKKAAENQPKEAPPAGPAYLGLGLLGLLMVILASSVALGLVVFAGIRFKNSSGCCCPKKTTETANPAGDKKTAKPAEDDLQPREIDVEIR